MSNQPRNAKAARVRWSDRALLEWIAERVEEFGMALQDLQNAVADVTAASEAEHAELAEVVSGLQAAEAQLTQLQTQVGQGAGVSEADIDALTATVAGIATKAQDAVAAAKQGTAAPAGGGTAPPPVARSEYLFDADPSTVDTTVWPASPNETSEAQPRPLFFYSGDTQNADGSWTSSGDGVGGVWHLYTGPTQPVGSGTSGAAGEA